MPFTVVTVAVGVAVALLAGGRARHLAGRRFRLCSLLVLGVVLQGLLERRHLPWGLALLVVSYGCVLVFTLANLRTRGMWMVALGFALNAAVIAVNSGMPVSRSAVASLATSDSSPWRDRPVVRFHTAAKYHLQRPSDRLMPLADVIPVPPLGQILSFGDLVLGVGVVDVLVHLMRPRRRRTPAQVPETLPSDLVGAER